MVERNAHAEWITRPARARREPDSGRTDRIGKVRHRLGRAGRRDFGLHTKKGGVGSTKSVTGICRRGNRRLGIRSIS